MPARPRFVFDTNAIISAALLKRSVSRRAFDKAIQQGEVLLSAETLDELNEVLGRPGFATYITEEERLEFLAVLLREAELTEVTVHVARSRDPRDDKFLELAVSGHATCIVTGDQDLLILRAFHDIPIVTPRDFLDKTWQASG